MPIIHLTHCFVSCSCCTRNPYKHTRIHFRTYAALQNRLTIGAFPPMTSVGKTTVPTQPSNHADPSLPPASSVSATTTSSSSSPPSSQTLRQVTTTTESFTTAAASSTGNSNQNSPQESSNPQQGTEAAKGSSSGSDQSKLPSTTSTVSSSEIASQDSPTALPPRRANRPPPYKKDERKLFIGGLPSKSKYDIFSFPKGNHTGGRVEHSYPHLFLSTCLQSLEWDELD